MKQYCSKLFDLIIHRVIYTVKIDSKYFPKIREHEYLKNFPKNTTLFNLNLFLINAPQSYKP